MAEKTVTIDTGEWIYLDASGIGHRVSNAETFKIDVTDGGASTVEYHIPVAQTVKTEDGYTLHFRPRTAPASGTGGNEFGKMGYLTDAGQGSDFYGIRGEISVECPVSGIVQHWHIATINPSDADFGSAGTIKMTLEDQFGNRMVLPSTGGGWDVA